MKYREGVNPNPYMYHFIVQKKGKKKTRVNKVIGKSYESAKEQIRIRFPKEHDWLILTCLMPDRKTLITYGVDEKEI